MGAKQYSTEALGYNRKHKGNGYGYACGSWNLKTYSDATCDVTVTHDESAVVLVETN